MHVSKGRLITDVVQPGETRVKIVQANFLENGGTEKKEKSSNKAIAIMHATVFFLFVLLSHSPEKIVKF